MCVTGRSRSLKIVPFESFGMFCRVMRCISAAYVVMWCLSVCLCVRPSRSWIMWKRMNVTSNRPIESRIWSAERCHFQWPWTTPTPGFKVTLFFDAEYLRNGTRYRHSFNGILIVTYILPTQQCYFEWPWVNLSDLAKYAMTRSIAQPLCDSRATCSFRYGDFTIFKMAHLRHLEL